MSRSRRSLLASALVLLCAAAAGAAPSAADGAAAGAAASGEVLVVGDFSLPPGESGLPAPWKAVLRAGKPDFSLERDGGFGALALRSRRSSFGLQRAVQVDVGDYRYLRWKWRADELPEGGDFRQARSDDQAAQLYVAFSKTKIIGYIWDTDAPEGTTGDAASLPPFVSIKIIVLRSGKSSLGSPLGRWLTETRDIRADYERLFGPATAPLSVQGLQLQINSQHTGTEAKASFADIVFARRAD